MPHPDIAIAEFYIRKQRSAQDRGIAFDLSFTSFKNMAKSNKCHFTGLTLTEKTFSIDRVDNRLGYVKGNVVACHKQFNQFKSVVENPDSVLTLDIALKGFSKLNKRLKEV